MSNPCICFGVGNNAEYIYDYSRFAPDVSARGPEIAAFACDPSFMPADQKFCELPVLPYQQSEIEKFWSQKLKRTDAPRLIFAVSYARFNKLRAEKYEQAKAWGFDFATYIHPSVKVWPTTEVGESCIVGGNVLIEPRARIGHDTIIRPGAYIGHHTTIGSHCWISPGAIICGECKIGDFSMIAAGAVIRDGTEVASGTTVGMGSVITRSTGCGEIYLAGVNNLQSSKT